MVAAITGWRLRGPSEAAEDEGLVAVDASDAAGLGEAASAGDDVAGAGGSDGRRRAAVLAATASSQSLARLLDDGASDATLHRRRVWSSSPRVMAISLFRVGRGRQRQWACVREC